MCSVFWLFWLSCHYLPSDRLERPLWGSLTMERDHVHKAQAEESLWLWQHCVIAAGLRQRTATRHVGQESIAIGTELTGQGGLSGPRSASATKLRQQLHWLPIRQRITYKISLITYKTQTTGTPTYLSNLIHDYLPTRTLPSSNKLLLTIPGMSLAMSAKSFSLSSPSVWNSLPYSCRSTKTVTTSKRALKTELFAIAYGSH